MANSPAFWPLTLASQRFGTTTYSRWPTLIDYGRFLESEHITNHRGNILRPIPPAKKAGPWHSDYEASIYLRGELAVYADSWHDFFQILAWATFPQAKRALNTAHYAALEQRMTSNDPARRGPVEDALTLFDENGALILCEDDTLLDHIRHLQWKTLFWKRRAELADKLRCIVFGHGLYEKALNPYVGMCAHAILLHCDPSVLSGSQKHLLDYADRRLAAHLAGGVASPRALYPFPLLGLPQWFDNNAEEFYDNTDYFRSLRQRGY